jgi:hypothetical protein
MKTHFLTSGVLLAVVLIITLLAPAACSQDGVPSTTISPPKTSISTTPSLPSTTRPTGPFVQITSPENASSSNIGSITIVIKTGDFKLTGDFGKANISGQGHVHYYMDVDPPASPDQPAITRAGTCVESSSAGYVWKNVGSGKHRFSVQLVNNDHTPLNPPAIATVSVSITAGAGMPALVIVSPREGEVISGESVTINTELANFSIADKIGQPNTANEGHLMFYRDVEAPTIQGPQATTSPGTYQAVAGTSCTWQNLSPGTHSFSVQLANNNNTPLNPPVSAKISISVK